MHNTLLTQSASVYIPADRRQALARGATLLERTTGAALFADISGFTPLTAALTRALGPRRGAEELPRHLNRVYAAVIAQIHRYGGSVIGFAGDAVTCWFAAETAAAASPPWRAATCALAIQTAMQHFAQVEVPGQAPVALSIKVAVASGAARRFVVGSPALKLIDTLAGATLARMSAAEHLAAGDEIVLDAPTAERLGARAQIAAWRTDADSGERFAVLAGLTALAPPAPWPPLSDINLTVDQVRPWVLPAVYARLEAGLGEFLTELRPTVAVFMRFTGLDYDADAEAGSKLDTFVRRVQGILARYGGTLIQLTIGDKGSYLYSSFGAPLAHEDDPRRAVSAALELRALPAELDFLDPLQIGISKGTMRTGTYGGRTRRTYGALGDEVNLSARLMQHSPAGEVLVSQWVYEPICDEFEWADQREIRVKGKSKAIPVARLVRKRPTRTEVVFAVGALIGREAELAQLSRAMRLLFTGEFAGLMYVYGEAGMGKSHLVYELRQQLPTFLDLPEQIEREQWFFCPAEAILQQSLNPFKYFLRGYFDQSPDAAEEMNKARFNEILNALIALVQEGEDRRAADLAAELHRTRSFLGALVGLHWTDSLYERLEPKLRFENTLSAFVTLIQMESLRRPVVLHLEDAHWLDAASPELLRMLIRAARGYPIAVLVTSRYRDDGSRFTIEVDVDVPQQVIDLNQLTPPGIRALAARLLAGELTPRLAEFITRKTGGNPFFVEQLTLHLHEHDSLHQEGAGWDITTAEMAEVPEGVMAVLVARLDRLTAHVKAMVQTAAVLGQEFEIVVLSEMLQGNEWFARRVWEVEEAEIWRALSEIRYIFRHALLRDAAYDMQLRERLRQLHTTAAMAIEQLYVADLDTHYADLAYHYGQADNVTQEHRYARLAGEHAADQFANAEAVRYLSRALELTATDALAERYAILRARAGVYNLQGAREVQRQDLEAMDALATALADQSARAEVDYLWAQYYEMISDYTAAQAAAERARDIYREIGDQPNEARSLSILGLIARRKAEYPAGLAHYQAALALLDEDAQPQETSYALNGLGFIHMNMGDYPAAQDCHERALALQRTYEDRRGEADSLNNLGMVKRVQRELAAAHDYNVQALAVRQAIGDRWGQGSSLFNLGLGNHERGYYAQADDYYRQALAVQRMIGNRWEEANILNCRGVLHQDLGELLQARTLFEQSLEISRAIGDREGVAFTSVNLGPINQELGEFARAEQVLIDTLNLVRDLQHRLLESYALTYLSLLHLARGGLEAARDAGQAALRIREELAQRPFQADNQAILAVIHSELAEPEVAVKHARRSVALLEECAAEGPEWPARDYFYCYRVLSATGHAPEARAALEAAYTLVMKRANHIADPELRHSFLENAEDNRAIIAAWEAAPQK